MTSFPQQRSSRTPALAWLLGATACWLLLAWQVSSDGPLPQVDTVVARWCHAVAAPTLTQGLLHLSAAHTLPPLVVAALLIGAWLGWRGDRIWSWLLPLALLGGASLNMALKESFQRARPEFSGLASDLHSYSFPSGHALHATVFYGLLALLAWHRLPARQRWPVAVLAGLMVSLVAGGRVVLGVHYLSDVLAGIVEGVAWLAFLATCVPMARAPREAPAGKTQ